jgi:hypothetical protein
MQKRNQIWILAQLVGALLLSSCAENNPEYEGLLDTGVAPSTRADASATDAGRRENDAQAALDPRVDASRPLDAAAADATSDAARLDASGPSQNDAERPGDAAEGPLADAALDAGSDASSVGNDASSVEAGSDAGTTEPQSVMLTWSQPAAGSTLKGTPELKLSGRALQNVEVFQSSSMLVRCTISSDRTSATCPLDTTKLANGSLTLTAHAWNSPHDMPFTSDADAGARTFNVDNSGGSTSNKPLVGAYCGNSVDGIKQFEQWLGRPVDGILGYTGNANWEDYDGSVGWAVGLWGAIDRTVFWSVPLIANGATLAQAGAGAYDDHYRKAAQTLANWRPQEPKLYIRTGWEFNGNWFPWSGQGKAADFAAAFRRFVTVFRSVSDRFVFEWNVNVGDVGMDPETAYPGDAYVDIIGMDFYWQPSLPTNPQQAWSQIVSQKWGLAWHQNFAKTHNKPTTYSEWGIRSNDAAYYIQQAKIWFETHDVLFHTYWNADNEYPGKLSEGQYPSSGAAYKTAFGP